MTETQLDPLETVRRAIPLDGEPKRMLLAVGDTSQRRRIVCPYHTWSYDLGGVLMAAKRFRDDENFDSADHALVELPVHVWEGWVFGHACNPLGSDLVPSFTEHQGDVAAR